MNINLIHQYIIECIHPENYHIKAISNKEKLDIFSIIFQHQCHHHILKYGYTNALIDYLQEFPPIINLDSEAEKIKVLVRKWGVTIDEQDSKILLNKWYQFIANMIVILTYKKYKKSI